MPALSQTTALEERRIAKALPRIAERITSSAKPGNRSGNRGNRPGNAGNRAVNRVGNRLPTATTRMASRYPAILPSDASVRAFVTWLVCHGEAGVWQQTDLYDFYVEACEAAGFRILAAQAFSIELIGLGLKRSLGDLMVDGRRRRPTCYAIPEVIAL